MIGVDANVLLRLLTADDFRQHQIAKAFFKERSSASPAFLSVVTLAETVWVLRRSYRFSKAEIGVVLTQILESDDFVVEARESMEFIRQKGYDPTQLGDYLVAHLCRKVGCSHVVTFDNRAVARVPGMELLA
jgi:predicted nucleic-acid-binding protein